jgi:putative transposase
MTIINRRYNYRIYPNIAAKQFLNQAIGNSRAMYNILLYQTKSEYELHKTNPNIYDKPNVSHFGLVLRVKDIRNNPETPWFLNTPFNCFTPIAKNLSLAYNTFFKSIAKGKPLGYPVFKKKTYGGSVAFPNNDRFKIIEVDNRYYLKLEGLWLSKGPMIPNLIRIKMNRPLPNEAKSLSIKCTASGNYYVSFLVEEETVLDQSRHKTIGIDLGLKTYITAYDGESTTKINSLKALKESEVKLSKYQRRYARKCKGSKNQAKDRIKVARIHETVANQRDYFVKYSISQLMKDCKAVVIEDLHTKGMMKNHKVAKAIGDASFAKFKESLFSYCEKHEVEVLLANRYYPSTQLCNSCGNRNDLKVKWGVDEWTCQHCGTIHDRDENAAMNLYDLAFVPKGTSYVKNLTIHKECLQNDSAIAKSFSKNQGNNKHKKRKSNKLTVS